MRKSVPVNFFLNRADHGRLRRARRCRVTQIHDTIQYKDKYYVHATVRCTDGPKEIIIRYTNPELSQVDWVSCTCEDHMYRFEYALWKKKLSSIIFSNGEPPETTNPRRIPAVCKHVLAGMREIPHKVHEFDEVKSYRLLPWFKRKYRIKRNKDYYEEA